ncbi:hypothetical protein NCC49_002963 [Naganishia albida]|nr:hypothetical protein NCC49_002963 [Naganishia albida]
MPSSRKIQGNAHAGPSTYRTLRIEDIPDAEKGEDELELEEVLFGKKRKRVTEREENGASVMDELEEAPAFFYDGGDADMDDAAEDAEKQASLSLLS